MKNDRLDEIEIVDALLDESDPAARRRIESAAAEHPDSKASLHRWERTLAALRGQSKIDRASARRAMVRVQEAVASPEAAPAASRADWRTRYFGGSQTGAWAAAASFAIVLAGGALLENRINLDTKISNQAAQAPSAPAKETIVAYNAAGLDREIQNVGDGGSLELKTGSFREAIRIAKPMRISAAGGNVRIGAAD